MSSYIEATLTANERVLLEGRLSLWMQWRPIAIGAGLVLLGIGLLFTDLSFGICASVMLAGLISWGFAYIEHHSTELAFTNKRIIVKTGIIARNTVEIPVSKIEAIQLQQSIAGRLLKYGSLTFSGTGTTHSPIVGVHDPIGFRRKCLEALEGVRGGK